MNSKQKKEVKSYRVKESVRGIKVSVQQVAQTVQVMQTMLDVQKRDANYEKNVKKWIQLLQIERGKNRPESDISAPVPLFNLQFITDWVPSASVRKRQRKLLADEASEIIEFRQQNRIWLARWRTTWAWIHWTRYLVGAPIEFVLKTMRKVVAGTG